MYLYLYIAYIYSFYPKNTYFLKANKGLSYKHSTAIQIRINTDNMNVLNTTELCS